ncbi:MAG: hypothetical protein HYY23_16730, partial [Verrucomicrobia bacterium]|nr:hypothetical protein [Verrucomicrobiota bacterium]
MFAHEPIPSPLPGGEHAIGASLETPLLGGAGGGSSALLNAQIKPLLPLPAFSETVLTDTNGNFRLVNLRPGKYQLRCDGPEGFIYPGAAQGTNAPGAVVRTVDPSQPQEGITFMFPEAKKGVWKNYPITQGLTELHPTRVHRTPDGLLWIATDQSFLYAYDGVEFKMMASTPEIPANEILAVQHAADGALWIGTSAGIGRHVGGQTEALTFGGSPAWKNVNDVLADPDGTVWFATGSGLGKYDGRDLVTIPSKEGLPGNTVESLLRARDGSLWMGTPQGLVRFDGQNFTLLQPFDGFGARGAKCLHQAKDGAIWFAGILRGGAYRYDGKGFSRLGVEHGLVSDDIQDIAETSDGALWFATIGGLSKFNGTTVLNYL